MYELDIAMCLEVALLFDLFGNDDCVCLAGALDRATRQRSRVGSFFLFPLKLGLLQEYSSYFSACKLRKKKNGEKLF